MNLLDLPDEALLSILGHLVPTLATTKTLFSTDVFNLSCTCQTFSRILRILIQNNEVLDTIHPLSLQRNTRADFHKFLPHDVSTVHCIPHVLQSSTIKQLALSPNTPPLATRRLIQRVCASVEKLSFHDHQGQVIDDRSLFKKCVNLKFLSVSHAGPTVVDGIQHIHHLEILNFYRFKVTQLSILQRCILCATTSKLKRLLISLDFAGKQRTLRLPEHTIEELNMLVSNFSSFLVEIKEHSLDLLSITSTTWGSLESQSLLRITQKCFEVSHTSTLNTTFEIQISPSEIDIIPSKSTHKQLSCKMELSTCISSINTLDSNSVLALCGNNITTLYDHGRLRSLHTAFDMNGGHSLFKAALKLLGKTLSSFDISLSAGDPIINGTILRNLAYVFTYLEIESHNNDHNNRKKFILSVPSDWVCFINIPLYGSLFKCFRGVKYFVLKRYNDDGCHRFTSFLSSINGFVKAILQFCDTDVKGVYVYHGEWLVDIDEGSMSKEERELKLAECRISLDQTIFDYAPLNFDVDSIYRQLNVTRFLLRTPV